MATKTIDKELEYFKMYLKYCDRYSQDLQEFQMLLANSRLNRYFNKEYQKKEKEALKTLKTVTSKKEKLHNYLMLEVLEVHSPVILTKETKKTEFYPLFNQMN